MRIKVKEALNQTEYKTEAKDGMDMALCIIDKYKNELQFSGAYNSLYMIRNGELLEYKAVRNPVGVHMKELPFQNEVVNFETTVVLWLHLPVGYLQKSFLVDEESYYSGTHQSLKHFCR